MILDRLPRCKVRHCLGGRGWTADGALEAYVWTRCRFATGGSAVQPPRLRGSPSYPKLRLSLLASVWLGSITMLVPADVRAQQGPFLYVPNAGDNTVSVIDTSTNTTAAPNIRFGGAPFAAGGLAIGTPSAAPNIPVGSAPFSAGVRGDQSFVYVTNISSNNVSVIDTSTNSVVATVGVGVNPFVAAVSPNGTFVYVSNNGASSVSVINAATNTVRAMGGSW